MVETMTGHDRRQGLALAMCCGSMDCKIEVFIQLVFACWRLLIVTSAKLLITVWNHRWFS